jgi:hypothetical protein
LAIHHRQLQRVLATVAQRGGLPVGRRDARVGAAEHRGPRLPSISTRTRSLGRSGGDSCAEMPKAPSLLCTESWFAGREITSWR